MQRSGLVVVMLAAVLVVAGCGDGDSGTIPSKVPVPAETVKGTTSTTATKTTTSTPSVVDTKAPEGPGDDVYIGVVSVTDAAAEFGEVLESLVEVRITDRTAEMKIDVTFEAIWLVGDDENEPCVSTNRWVLTGTGSAVPTMDFDLFTDSVDILAISGCEMDDEDEDEAIPFLGSVENGTVTGIFFGDLFMVTAERR